MTARQSADIVSGDRIIRSEFKYRGIERERGGGGERERGGGGRERERGKERERASGHHHCALS